MTTYQYIQTNHPEAAFIANVILTSQSKPQTKLRNLKKLLVSGSDIRPGNEIDSIIIDGEYNRLNVLN